MLIPQDRRTRRRGLPLVVEHGRLGNSCYVRVLLRVLSACFRRSGFVLLCRPEGRRQDFTLRRPPAPELFRRTPRAAATECCKTSACFSACGVRVGTAPSGAAIPPLFFVVDNAAKPRAFSSALHAPSLTVASGHSPQHTRSLSSVWISCVVHSFPVVAAGTGQRPASWHCVRSEFPRWPYSFLCIVDFDDGRKGCKALALVSGCMELCGVDSVEAL